MMLILPSSNTYNKSPFHSSKWMVPMCVSFFEKSLGTPPRKKLQNYKCWHESWDQGYGPTGTILKLYIWENIEQQENDQSPKWYAMSVTIGEKSKHDLAALNGCHFAWSILRMNEWRYENMNKCWDYEYNNMNYNMVRNADFVMFYTNISPVQCRFSSEFAGLTGFSLWTSGTIGFVTAELSIFAYWKKSGAGFWL